MTRHWAGGYRLLAILRIQPPSFILRHPARGQTVCRCVTRIADHRTLCDLWLNGVALCCHSPPIPNINPSGNQMHKQNVNISLPLRY